MDDRKVLEVSNINGKKYSSVIKPNEEAQIADQPKKKTTGLISKDWLKKFKTVKGFNIIIPVILLCVLLVGYITLTKNSDEERGSSTENVEYTSALEYASQIEDSLAKVLSNVKGAGNVSVMVTLTSGPELIYATSKDTETNTISSGSNTTTTVTVVEEPIVVTRNGESTLLILMEKMSEVKGVIVVSSGASDVRVKLQLIEAIQSLLDVEDGNIQVITGI